MPELEEMLAKFAAEPKAGPLPEPKAGPLPTGHLAVSGEGEIEPVLPTVEQVIAHVVSRLAALKRNQAEAEEKGLRGSTELNDLLKPFDLGRKACR